ncbi:MAG: xanthine dehydrogenase family protein subunit M [Deltaproteobacteria bacterium]|nr:xanthine dehydrogenase family protein subunit M [Deltaproteobacteria bacterium]
MPLPKFKYLAPKTWEEACAMLAQYKGKVRVMAGGTDLLIKMSLGAAAPEYVIGLKNIPGLDYIKYDQTKGLTLGPLALLADVADHPMIKEKYDAVAHAASVTATVQVRNMGTVAGNLCNAAPSADNIPALMALDAEVTLARLGGKRMVKLDDFFQGPGKTVMEPEELLEKITVPAPSPGSGTVYLKISPRSKVDIAAVGVGAHLVMAGDVCQAARIVLGAVAPVPMRARKAESLLTGQKLTTDLINQAAAQAADEARPITDVRTTAEYRKTMVYVLTRRAINACAQKALPPCAK